MQLTLWALFAAGLAVGNEWLYRTLPGHWSAYLYLWVPIQLGISYGLYKIITTPNTTLIDAMIIFTFSTMTLRIIASYGLGDRISVTTWAAFGLLLMARFVQTLGK